MTDKQTLKRCSIPAEFSFTTGQWGENKSKSYYNVPSTDMSKKDLPKCTKKDVVYSIVKGRKKAASFKNVPMHVKIVGFNKKNFMVVSLPCDKLVSMETDVFYEALKHGGIDKDGQLNDEFVVAGINGRMKLIRKDSGLHKTVLAYEAKKALPKIKILEYKKGTLYRTASGMYGVYMGYVTTLDYKYDYNTKVWNKRVIKKASLWRDFGGWQAEAFNKSADLEAAMQKSVVWNYRLRINTRFVEATPYKTKLENDCVSRVANAAAAATRKDIKENENSRYRYHGYKTQIAANDAKLYNMVLFGLDPRQHERDILESVK